MANTKYGAKFVENLSRDILAEFPNIKGFSVRNLKYMRKFYEIYPDLKKVQQGVALLPWRNNLTLMSKVKDESERQWYIAQNLENGWNGFWGTGAIDTISEKLQQELPGLRGFSNSNMKNGVLFFQFASQWLANCAGYRITKK